ncbi:hypothetical protein [Nocardia salmonicida]
MEPVDAAFEEFSKLRMEIATYDGTLITESDVRAKVIDPIFMRVLGWRGSELLTENPVANGFIDYVFSIEGRSRLVVEAKRDARPLGCAHKDAGRGYVLGGPVFKTEAAKEGIAQAIRYCAMKNAELACITNGKEWVVFRGTRLGDGTDTMKGMGLVFPSLQAVSDKFDLFYRLLSRDDVERHEFRAYFQEIEGLPIRSSKFKKSIRQHGSEKMLPSSRLASDLDRIMTSFFDRLTGDDDNDLLLKCFVETSESRSADVQLARISEDVIMKIRSIDTSDPDELTRIIQRATETKRHEFVVIVGTKGAGKSTFISRFFSVVLPEKLATSCVSCRINLAHSTGDSGSIVNWLDNHLLSEFEKAVFGEEPPTFNELEGMFFDDYQRLRRGTWSKLYETDKTQFQIQFGQWVERRREERPNEYIQGVVRHVVKNRKKLPVIVFDNADHFAIDFQEKVYQYARSIYESAICMIVLPITDRTSWQLSRQGAMQSFDHEALFLPTPPTEQVIKKRIDFLQGKVEDAHNMRPDERYYIKGSFSLTVRDLQDFTRSLQRVFLETDKVAKWIGSLSNNDVRRALRLARQFVTSGHLRVEDLLRAHLTGSSGSIKLWNVMRAMLRGNYDIFPVEQSEFVQNIFGIVEDADSSPLHALSILQLLDDVPADDNHEHLISVSQTAEYCEALGYDSRSTRTYIDSLLKSGLCHDYDPMVTDIARATRIQITPAGRQHLYWARSDFYYLDTMADVTHIRNRSVFDDLNEAISPGGTGWRGKTRIFIDYLLHEDAVYCNLPQHEAYDGQRRLRELLKGTRDRLHEDRQGKPSKNDTESRVATDVTPS